MKKESMQEVLNQMTPKQLEGLRFLTESGRLEDLVKDLVANLELTTTSKSTKKESKKKEMTAMEASLVEQGLSLEEAREWLSET